MDGAAETTLTVKNGEATLTIRDGQTVTIKEIPVGTAYTVEETDERAQGYNIDASAYTSGGGGMIATDKEARVELKNVRNAGSLDDPQEDRRQRSDQRAQVQLYCGDHLSGWRGFGATRTICRRFRWAAK